MAGVYPDAITGESKRASILAMDSKAAVGSVTVCAQAQWHPPTSPSTQLPASSLDAISITVSIDAVATMVVVAEPSRLSGPSVRQIVPAVSLISMTATAKTHNPRWRRRRVSSDGEERYIG